MNLERLKSLIKPDRKPVPEPEPKPLQRGDLFVFVNSDQNPEAWKVGRITRVSSLITEGVITAIHSQNGEIRWIKPAKFIISTGDSRLTKLPKPESE